MRVFRSLLVGVVAAVLAVVLGTFVELALALSRITGQISGGGGLGAVSWETYSRFYALFGFAGGFYWQFRRTGRRSHAAG